LIGSRGNYNIRVKLHRHLLLQEAAFFDSTETGILLSRLNNDVNKIGMVISFHVNVVFRQFAQLVFGAVYLLQICRELAFVAFGGILVVAVVSAVYGDFSRILAERVQNMFADASAIAEKSFSMSETVRAFDGVKTEVVKYESAQCRALELEEVQAWAYGSHKFISDSLQTMMQGMLLLSCWSFGRSHKLPVAKLTTFMFYVNFVLESSNEVGDQWAKIQSAIGASSNVFELIRRVPKIRDPVELKEVLSSQYPSVKSDPNVNGSTLYTFAKTAEEPVIRVENLTVTYGAMDDPALNKVNLDIFEGDRVAIVGRSGSGKSTLLRSLLRFYDPISGSCKLEGKNLQEFSRKELASRISVVEQEPHLFPMSLMNNVLYGIDKDAFDEDTGEDTYSTEWRIKVAEALEVAGLSVDGALKNNMGLELDTRVGEGGRTLSGGQRQVSTFLSSFLTVVCQNHSD
jgi:ABC-type multidrug transport system fused ATPase/permease subunit